MSEYKGCLGCPRCGPAGVRLEDWDTYVSVTCGTCGHKFGELVSGPGPAGNAPAVRPGTRQLHGMAFIAHHAVADRAQREFTEGFRRGLTAAATRGGGELVPEPTDWCDYGFNAALGVFPDGRETDGTGDATPAGDGQEENR